MSLGSVLEDVNLQLGSRYQWRRHLSGGEQNGAHLVVDAGHQAVLKVQTVEWKAKQLLQAFPAVTYAADGGWPVARWLHAAPLITGGAFVLQEYVQGTVMSSFGVREVEVVVAVNELQSGLAFAAAADDSAQLEAVLSGDTDWKWKVATFTPAGADLVEHGDRVARWAASASIPVIDVVHGDYSSSNILFDAVGRARLVDCETVSRGSRVRDLADLYRQSYVYPDASATGLRLLRGTGIPHRRSTGLRQVRRRRHLQQSRVVG